MTDNIHKHVRGMALGAAIGDALGMPLEFKAARAPGLLLKTMIAGRLPAGYITDDTEMAIALSEALIEKPGFHHELTAAHFLKWYERCPADIGGQTSAALSTIKAGYPATMAAKIAQADNPLAAGNGAIMRAWPIIAAYWMSYPVMITYARDQGALTHSTPPCHASMVFLASALYYLIRGIDKFRAIDLAVIDVDAAETFLVDAAETFEGWPAIASAIGDAPARSRSELPNTGWVKDCLEASVWALLTTQTFTDAVCQAVNLGHDADTTGAVTGMLAGACYGEDAIMSSWLKALQVQWPIHTGPIYEFTFIRDLADQLYHLI